MGTIRNSGTVISVRYSAMATTTLRTPGFSSRGFSRSWRRSPVNSYTPQVQLSTVNTMT